MYRGFNLEYYGSGVDEDDHQAGLELYKSQKFKVHKTLGEYVSVNGSLDGSQIQEDWFTLVEADIFLSHSRQNEDIAIKLAGWLYRTFKLKTFIDSCIWGHSNHLLKLIDNEHCMNTDKTMYDYDKRNYSTSHVHMMLSTALGKMIDKSECVFFLNTPESIKSSETVKEKTNSPWIYSELAMTKMVRRKSLQSYRSEKVKLFAKSQTINEEVAASLNIEYQAELDHLTKLTYTSLAKWEKEWNKHNDLIHTPKKHALDILYSQNSTFEKSIIYG